MSTATDVREITADQRRTILDQIGSGTVMGICGFRVRPTVTGVELVCGYGYRVRVTLEANDTYTVRRIYSRGSREWVKGEQTDVYWPELSEVAYRAGMFRDEWV